MKKVCVVTTSRAEYGTLRYLLESIRKNQQLELCLVVTGTHLVAEFGYTLKEIEADGFYAAEKIDIMMMSDFKASISKTMGIAMISFADMFQRQKPDLVVLAGDRYELLSIACCAMNERIPIAHISGGETTEGAVDEVVRHALTKMSLLHFPACEAYRKRIIQMGEHPNRVFNIGDFGVENINRTKLLTIKELEKSIGISLDKPYALVTFHPVTLEENTAIEQLNELLQAIEQVPDMKYIITKANGDENGKKINQALENFCQDQANCFLEESLGSLRYLSAVKYAQMVIGNSSSGIIEAPTLKVATINIGDRQRGRLQAESIINCEPKSSAIIESIKFARTDTFVQKVRFCKNPYENKNTTELFIDTITDFLHKEQVSLKKVFYDI